jgi:hypothetical protein
MPLDSAISSRYSIIASDSVTSSPDGRASRGTGPGGLPGAIAEALRPAIVVGIISMKPVGKFRSTL